MSTTTSYPFTTAGNYSYDTNLVEFVDGKAQLKLIDYPSQTFSEDFDSDTGFTYNSDEAEFISAGTATSHALYASSIDLDDSVGSTTGTASGGATVSGGKLDLAHNDTRYVSYDPVNNVDLLLNAGCIEFDVTPNYSGTPTTQQDFWHSAGTTSANRILISHLTSGQLLIRIYDSGGSIINIFQAAWSQQLGVEYKFSINWNWAASEARVFINGTQFASTSTSTGTRTNAVTVWRVGDGGTGTSTSNFKLDNLAIYTTAQRTTSYTPAQYEPASIVRQKDQLPNVRTYSPWDTTSQYEPTIYAAGISPDMTTIGSPSILNGKLEIESGDGVKFDDHLNILNVNEGCIRVRFTKGTETTYNSGIFRVSTATNNQIRIDHTVSNDRLEVQLRNSSGSSVFNEFIAIGSYDIGDELEIEVNYKTGTGDGLVNFYVDGVKQHESTGLTWARNTTNVTLMACGFNGAYASLCKLRDLYIGDTVENTGATYTSPVTYPDARYLETFVESPTETANGAVAGTLQSIDDFTVVHNGIPHFTFGDAGGTHYWWTGSTWTISDKSYAQSNTHEDLLTYLTYFPFPDGTTQFRYGIVFCECGTQMYVDSLDIEYTYQIYSTTNPTVVPNSTFRTSNWESISATTTETGSDAVKFIAIAGAQDRWVTGGSADNSDGTYAQSSTLAELTSDISDLISTSVSSTAKIFLHSDDGLTTPSIDLLAITYNLAPLEPVLTACSFDGYIYDHDGPLASELVQIRPFQGFINSTALHKYEWKTLGTTDAKGWFTADIYVQATSAYWEMKVGTQRYKFQLPDSGEADFSNLTSFEVVEV